MTGIPFLSRLASPGPGSPSLSLMAPVTPDPCRSCAATSRVAVDVGQLASPPGPRELQEEAQGLWWHQDADGLVGVLGQ